MMELEQLRIFLAVAESHSFTAAARRLFVSHSTTSRAVAALEAELGVRLFDRDRRSVALTAAGRVLRQEAEALLRAADEAVAAVRTAAAEEAATCTNTR